MRFIPLLLAAVGFLTGTAPLARAEMITDCNFSFEGSPDDRGSVQIIDRGGQISMQVVEDDNVSTFDKVKVSAATGDQIRTQITKDTALKADMGDAKVYLQDVGSSKAYTVDGVSGSTVPAAQFFTFYASDQRFLGGFGSIGPDRFFCDWVSVLY